MPLEPPDPLKILEALRTIRTQLQAYVTLHPEDTESASAASSVEAAIASLERLIQRTS